MGKKEEENERKKIVGLWLVGRRLTDKILRAHGGCLGMGRRRRTCQAAKSHGELHRSVDPWMSEWGNPPRVIEVSLRGGEPPELKHLSRGRRREQVSDSASSGERTRTSPNRYGVP